MGKALRRPVSTPGCRLSRNSPGTPSLRSRLLKLRHKKEEVSNLILLPAYLFNFVIVTALVIYMLIKQPGVSAWLLASILITLSAAPIIRWIMYLNNTSALRGEALDSLLDNFVDVKRLCSHNADIFITVACDRRCHTNYDYWDRPESKRYFFDRLDSSSFETSQYTTDFRLGEYVGSVPEYIRIEESSRKDAIQLLSASMSLPYGIFPQREISGVRCEDGGVVDNIPIYPAVVMGCDLIIVVHLKPKPMLYPYSMWKKAHIRRRLIEVETIRATAGFETPISDDVIEDGIFSAAQSLEGVSRKSKGRQSKRYKGLFDSVEIIHVRPSVSLGLWYFGTVAFSKTRANRLIKLGRDDALKCIHRLRSAKYSGV